MGLVVHTFFNWSLKKSNTNTETVIYWTYKWSIKQFNIESLPHYFFIDMINIKNFDPNLLNIDKVSFKSTDAVIYNIKYVTMKSLAHANIDSEISLYLIFNNVDGYIEKSNKYLIFTSVYKNKEVLKKYTELWNEIKNQMETINSGELIAYKKDFMKIRFESDDDLPLAKIMNIPSMIIVTRSVFQETINIIHKFIYMDVVMNF